MAFVPTAIVQDRSFMVVKGAGAIAPEFNSPIVMTCLDTQGNTIKKTIVEVNASAGAVEVMLPSIASLGNDLNCEISIVVLDNTSAITIYANYDYVTPLPPTDYIGQTQSIIVAPATYTAGAVLTLTPAYEGYWSLNETIN